MRGGDGGLGWAWGGSHSQRVAALLGRVRLCATPETAAHQAFHPWDSPGKNTGVGCHFLLLAAGRAKRGEEGWEGQVFSQSPEAGFHTID